MHSRNQRICEIVLRRSTSYMSAIEGVVVEFRRGEVTKVPENIYHDLLRTGAFADPHRQIDVIHPRRLGGIGRGQTVPVIRDVGMGDVIMAAVGVRWLAEKYRGKLRIIYACASPYAPLFRGADWNVAEVVSLPDLRGNYSWAIDLRGFVERHKFAGKKDRMGLFANYLLDGPPADYESPLKPTEEWRKNGRLIGGMKPGRPTLIYTARASFITRTWGLKYHRRFVELATSHGWQVILVDSKKRKASLGEGPLVRDLRGKITVKELGDLIAAADVVLSPDTGNIHLGEALKTRTVGYFTMVDPRLRVANYRYTRALYPNDQLPCLNCTYTPTCGESAPMPCANLTTPERAWREVEWTMAHEPPFQPYAWQGADNPERIAPKAEEVFVV